MSIGLTRRQADFLDWLRGDPRRCSMSMREMAKSLGYKHASSIHYIIEQLEARRMLRRLPRKHRSIKLLLQAGPGLRLVAGPDHWERRAEEKRRQWGEAA
jgi:SOS-response transcriptional repressor LexA